MLLKFLIRILNVMTWSPYMIRLVFRFPQMWSLQEFSRQFTRSLNRFERLRTLKKQHYPSILLNLSVILDQHLLQHRRPLSSVWRARAAAFALVTLHLQPFSPRRRRHWTEETMEMHLETKLDTTHRFFLQTLIVLTTPHKPVKVESNSAADSNVQVPSHTGRRVVR